MSTVRRIAFLLAATLTLAASAEAAERWAVIGPGSDPAYHAAVAEGCRRRAAEIGGAECRFVAPGGAENRDQARIVADLLADGVDGLAVAPVLIAPVAEVLGRARAAGIPVVAYDVDLPERARDAFVGTDARGFGRALGATLRRWRPDGGRYALISGDAASRGLAERLDGIRDVLGPRWIEIAGSPLRTTGETREAARLLDQLLLDDAELDAVITVGPWPFLDEDTWREIAGRHRDRLDRARVVLVSTDALPAQRRLLRDGAVHVLVDRRPTEIGARIAEVLAARRAGRRAPDATYVGFDVLTRRDVVDAPN